MYVSIVANISEHPVSVVLNLFAERSQIQIYNFVREPHERNFNIIHLTRFVYRRTKSVTQNIRRFIVRLLRSAQRVVDGSMWLSEQ